MERQQQRHTARVWASPQFWIWITQSVVLLGCVTTWVLWMWGGSDQWMTGWMRSAGLAALLLFPLAEFAFCAVVRMRFSADQHARGTWTYLALAALLRFGGTLIAQWLPAIGLLDFIYRTPEFGDLRWLGYFLSGSAAMTFYLLGLLSALQTYRRHLIIPALPLRHRILLAATAAFVVQQLAVLFTSHRDQLASPSNWLNWATDPLLLALLLLSLRLCAASGALEGGLLGRVWLGYASGFAFILLGDMGSWITNMGYVTWFAASPLAWFAWYPAVAALASGACSQWQAVTLARRARALAADAPPASSSI